MTSKYQADKILEDWLLNGSPGSAVMLRENFGREEIVADLAAWGTGVMISGVLVFQVGDLVTTLNFLSGATALGTPTNEWAALFDLASPSALLSQSTSVTTAWAADTAKGFTLAVPQLITKAGVYYWGLMIAATTPPSLMGRTSGRAPANGAIVAGQKVRAQTSGSALAAAAPATIASPTTVATEPYCVAT